MTLYPFDPAHADQAHFAEDPEALLTYLYEDGDPGERQRLNRHLVECERCASAVRELRAVRGALADWTPPAAELGFRIVQDPIPAAQASLRGWIARPLPRRVQLAAAILLFSLGAALAQFDLQQFGAGALTLRTKWRAAEGRASGVGSRESGPVPQVPRSAIAQAPATMPSPRTPAGMVALETTLRESLAAGTQASTGTAQSADTLLRRVQTMIEQSEQRQQRELALRLAQVVREFDEQRRADLLRVEQNFGQLEGQTGAAVAQQRELLDYLVRVSQPDGR